MKTNVKDVLATANATVPRLQPAEVGTMIGADGVLLVDVRDPTEVQASRKIKGGGKRLARKLEFRADPESQYHNPVFRKDKRIALYCASGGRSALAGKVLQDLGYQSVFNAGSFKELTRREWQRSPSHCRVKHSIYHGSKGDTDKDRPAMSRFSVRARRIASPLSKAKRIAVRGTLLLLFSPLILILIFRVLPVPLTPLMVMRFMQGYGIRNDWVAYNSIAPAMAQAVVASEDNLFPRAFRLRRRCSSGSDRCLVARGRPRGASTITMQTARNLLLGQDGAQRARRLRRG